MGGTCLPLRIHLCKGWITRNEELYRRSVTVSFHTWCFDRSMDRPRRHSTNRQIKTKRTHCQSVVRFSMGGETKMKRLLGMLFTLCLVFSLSTSVFADRILLIPDVPKTPYRGGVGLYEGVVAHSTATPEAPAINIQRYETRTWRNAFVHYAVDWNETIQIADTKYMAYGAGPAANKRFVHVELCETADYSKFKRSYEKYVRLLARILKDNNLSVDKGLWTHNDVRKYLGGTDHEDPIDYLRSHGVLEAQFRSDVQQAYNNSSVDVSVPSKPEEVPTAVTDGIAYILGNNVNLRKGPGTSYSVIRQLNKPEAYQVWGEKDGWLNLVVTNG